MMRPKPLRLIISCPFCQGGSCDCRFCRGGGEIEVERIRQALLSQLDLQTVQILAKAGDISAILQLTEPQDRSGLDDRTAVVAAEYLDYHHRYRGLEPHVQKIVEGLAKHAY